METKAGFIFIIVVLTSCLQTDDTNLIAVFITKQWKSVQSKTSFILLHFPSSLDSSPVSDPSLNHENTIDHDWNLIVYSVR